MARPPSIIPKKHLHTTLPHDIAARLDLFLWSEVEGRVPSGAYQEFLCDRIREFFDQRKLDLAPFLLNAQIGQHIISASPYTLAALTKHLKGEDDDGSQY